ncbi:MAG: amylo-alpha-1,6-glucosidase [Omnitrophica WOR_2 bacterium]
MSFLETPLPEDPIPEFLSLPSQEDPDWGYARTRRAVLMVPSAEWVQSVYSCQVNLNGTLLVTPNRDYPYEGLLVYQDSENWKLIDCVGLGLQYKDHFLRLAAAPGPQAVMLNPWRATYVYHLEEGPGSAGSSRLKNIPFYISYYLHSQNAPDWISGCIELYCPGWPAQEEDYTFILQPFVDFHHMFHGSDFDGYRFRSDEDLAGNRRIHLSLYNRTLTFYLPEGELNRFESPEFLTWRYKLGTGERVEAQNPYNGSMETVFKSEEKRIAAFFNLRIPALNSASPVRLFFGCGIDDEPVNDCLADVQNAFSQSRKKDLQQYRQLQELFPLPESHAYREAIWARIAGLTKFKTYIHLEGRGATIPAPHAGAWWFKTPWYRDVFEGLLNSFSILTAIPEERQALREIVLLALEGQDTVTGRIMNRIPEVKQDPPSYNTSDGTLLCFITAYRYARENNDLELALRSLAAASRAIGYFNREADGTCEPYCVDAAPRVDAETGLLLSVPQHSWIDTRSQKIQIDGQEVSGLTNRASPRFVRDLHAALDEKASLRDYLASPNIFLPEINAQWINMLRGTVATIDFALDQPARAGLAIKDPDSLESLKALAQKLLAQAERTFKRVFWNPNNGFLYNMVDAHATVRDEIESEPGVVAAALLGKSIFTRSELSSIWNCIRERLLVYRTLVLYGNQTLPFGIMVRNVGQNIFYNDDQYHSDVVWLRSTAYLIKLLRMLDEEQTIRWLMMNALDHQMSEGALFYNQELLARPFGNNPAPAQATRWNPVPVKNPIQFWSQWCDAFVQDL